ncbi:hypothetical protein BGZ65_004762 [Modicella reniformis]|uniref:Uncharacterized protein n=1 Tax=Modicella reniformis TaxID=1440133 RepID=A0A9P6IK37_9FUNG|nr:hypothetical protein BGZ65_004762 [Modicella reniformis]
MAAFSVNTKTRSFLLPSPSPSRSSPRLQSAHSLALIPFLVLSILLTSLLIPLAESTSLSLPLRNIDSSTPPSLDSFLQHPSEVQVQELDKVSSQSALVDSSIESSIDLSSVVAVAVAVPEQPHLVRPFHKRAPQAPSTTEVNPTKTKASGSSKATMSSTPTAAPTPAFSPDAAGDMALFGKPSVIAAYNLTSGILIYSAFMIFFVAAVGTATWRRAKYRNQFRLHQQRNMESGRVAGDKGPKGGSGDAELSDAALFKQASISKRALMKDVGPGGTMAANEAIRTKIAAANGAGRSFEEREMSLKSESGPGVRFGENTGGKPATGRTGGMKSTRGDVNQGAYEMNSYGAPVPNPLYYQDNHDTTDYSRPPLTESTDPYYSSGSSHSGYLDQVEDYHFNPQKSKVASSSPQPQYQQPTYVNRTNSNRMPNDGNSPYGGNSGRATPTGLDRNGSNKPPRIATQGNLDRSGSDNSGHSLADGNMSRQGSNASSSRTRVGVAGSPKPLHPTPIARSNSSRLPPTMRGGGPPPPSGLGQSNNNYDDYQ